MTLRSSFLLGAGAAVLLLGLGLLAAGKAVCMGAGQEKQNRSHTPPVRSRELPQSLVLDSGLPARYFTWTWNMEPGELGDDTGLSHLFPDSSESRLRRMFIPFPPASGPAPGLPPTLPGGPVIWEHCYYFIERDIGMGMLRDWTGDDALPPQKYWHLRSGGIALSSMHASYISFYEVDLRGLSCFASTYDSLIRLSRLNYAVWEKYYSDRVVRSCRQLDDLELYHLMSWRMERAGQ